VKIFDAVAEMPLTDVDGKVNEELLESYFNKVMSVIDENDIVFVGTDTSVRNKFNENGIDYDIFYPSVERRGEFIENQVRKRANPKDIRNLDKNFKDWVEEIDNDESKNCYKHKLNAQGEFIGNAPIIMQYIDSLNQNEQK
jgi:hypothetical protein